MKPMAGSASIMRVFQAGLTAWDVMADGTPTDWLWRKE
jgi:hypothetical protein